MLSRQVEKQTTTCSFQGGEDLTKLERNLTTVAQMDEEDSQWVPQVLKGMLAF